MRTPRNLKAMNFSIDCTERKNLSLQRVVPLLVLVKQWGDLGKDAFQHVDIVLLLLQGIQLGDEGKVGALLLEKKATWFVVCANGGFSFT